MSNKIPPLPTGKHVSSAKKESLSSLRRSNSASRLSNDAQAEANLSEKNRLLVVEVDRLKCLVHEKQNRISELDDENYQFRDYINRLEQEALRLKDSYDELEAKHAQLKYDQHKLQSDFDQLLETQTTVGSDTDEQALGLQKFFKYVQRIASDVNKMMQYKKYLNGSSLNLPSRPSTMSSSFRQSGRSNRRSSLLVHDQNLHRRSREEPLPMTLTSSIEREELLEKSAALDKTEQNNDQEAQDQSMREENDEDDPEEEEECEDEQVILDTQPAEKGLGSIVEESEGEQDQLNEQSRQCEEPESDQEEETVDETEEIEETVQSSEEEEEEEEEEEDEDEEEEEEEETKAEEQIFQETTKNVTYVVNETHNVDETFDANGSKEASMFSPQVERKSVKFECGLDESESHAKYAKTPFRKTTKPLVDLEESMLDECGKEKKKSILKVRSSDQHKRQSHKFDDLDNEPTHKSIFKTKKNTPTKITSEVNHYLEDLVDEAAQNDKENSKKCKQSRAKGKSVKKFDSDTETDNSSDEDFAPGKAKCKSQARAARTGLPPLPAKKPKRPIESVYEQKQVLKQTQNLSVKTNRALSNSNLSKEASELDNSASRSPNINNLLSKKLRLSPDSEDSIDTSQSNVGETGSARRARKAVSYKELPLNTKIRRDKDNRVCIRKLTCKVSNPNEDLVKYSRENHKV